MDWISTKTKLPKINKVVLVTYPSGYDGKPVYAWGARCDGCEDENGRPAWCWGVKASGGSNISPHKDGGWNDVEVDDDYPVTHWMPLPVPPKERRRVERSNVPKVTSQR